MEISVICSKPVLLSSSSGYDYDIDCNTAWRTLSLALRSRRLLFGSEGICWSLGCVTDVLDVCEQTGGGEGVCEPSSVGSDVGFRVKGVLL